MGIFIKKANLNLITDVIIFFPMFLLALSGLVIQAVFHMGHHGITFSDTMVLGFTRSELNDIHKILSIVTTVAVFIHLYFHRQWVKRKLLGNIIKKNAHRNTRILFVTFSITLITGFLAWLLNGIDAELSIAFREIHDKIGIILTIIFIIHLVKHFRWLKKSFLKNVYNRDII
jgi:hypothetical protein